MLQTEKEIEKIATEELNKRYGKGAENKTMNKIWITGFMVGFAMGQKDAMPLSAENSVETNPVADDGKAARV